jgi:hypothetical protein
MTYTRTLTAAVFLVFLSRLRRITSGKILLIVDRLWAHEAAAVENWLQSRRDLSCGPSAWFCTLSRAKH